ncbi:hypothetical protein E2320_009423, partial [Naja naja]
HLQW